MINPRRLMRLLVGPLVLAGGCGGAIETHRLIDASDLDGQVPTTFLLTDEGRVLVCTDRSLFDVGAQEYVIYDHISPISASVMVGDQPAVLIRNVLYGTGEDAKMRLLGLPLSNIVMAGARESTYIAGVTPTGRARLFIYLRLKGSQPILELAKPIDAMTMADERVYFAAGASIFTFKPGEEVVALAMVPDISRISWLAVDPDESILYLSDGTATYAILREQNSIVLLFRDAGGPLGCHGGALYLLRRQDETLYRIEGLSSALTSGSPPLVDLK